MITLNYPYEVPTTLKGMILSNGNIHGLIDLTEEPSG